MPRTASLALVGFVLSGCTPMDGHLWADREAITPGSLSVLEGVYEYSGQRRQCANPDGSLCRVSFSDAIEFGLQESASVGADSSARLEIRVQDPRHIAVHVRSGQRTVYEETLEGRVTANGYFTLSTRTRVRLTPAIVLWALRRNFVRLGVTEDGTLLVERDASSVVFVTVLPAFGGEVVTSDSFARVEDDG